jgi:hypothetical protein
VLGFAAGLCNEHTGPALAAIIAVALVVFVRRGERLAAWGTAGLVGLIGGGVALFLAPGQKIRYNGLATEHGTIGRILDRGVAANGRIVGAAVLFLLPLLVWVVLALVARHRTRPPAQPRSQVLAQLAMAGVSLAITLTLLASPKQGMRLYLASVVLACAAVAGWVVAQCAARWARGVAATLAAGVLAYASFECVTTYHTLAREFAERVRLLDAAPDNGVADIPVYTVRRTRWSVGDDLLIENIRNHVSYSFGLALVRMHQRDDTSPPPEAPDDP